MTTPLCWVDSHCHLDRLAPGSTPEQIWHEAHQAGVGHILSVCVRLEELPAIQQWVQALPSVSYSVGVHPTEVSDEDESVERLLILGRDPKVVAIGETGLDAYREADQQRMHEQSERFERHIEVARLLNKPLIIHTRAARKETIAQLKHHQNTSLTGVLHCFTEDKATAKAALDLGYLISFSGIVTFKNAQELQEVARFVPEDRLLVETDAPYLAPMPHRGKSNVPAYVAHTGAFVAQLRGWTLAQCATLTTANFLKLFGPHLPCTVPEHFP